MSSSKFCCVPNCPTTRSEDENITLHNFPDPNEDLDRFRAWLCSVGGNLLDMDSQFVHKNRKVCHNHFESQYHTRNSRLSANAVPTLQLQDVTNIVNNNPEAAITSTSAGPSHFMEPMMTITNGPPLLAETGARPGINKKIFKQLKKRVLSMTRKQKLCILLFDEIPIRPRLSRKGDSISGFFNSGNEAKRNVVDHALVFMLRGAVKNYKHPLAYTFCKGNMPVEDLKNMIKNIISELLNCGFIVLATVCDQGTRNISTINELIKETREEHVKRNEYFKHRIFEVNGKEIIPLFSPPHLMKGIRNNLLTKKLKCIIDDEEKVADWDHILKLYEENPGYRGIRLIENLTEDHVDPRKIPKKNVKMAIQILSATVARFLVFLSSKGILPKECKDTGDVLIFFDKLFDSVNGSKADAKEKSWNILLRPVTPTSKHSVIWADAKEVLKSMKFMTKNGKEGSVPSVRSWLRTIENMEYLKNKLFKKYRVMSIWMRHFSLDPLEDFFDSIRSHGRRKISLFRLKSAFASL